MEEFKGEHFSLQIKESFEKEKKCCRCARSLKKGMSVHNGNQEEKSFPYMPEGEITMHIECYIHRVIDLYIERKNNMELNIKGIEGYETFKIDDNPIGIRPKWISVKEKLPEISNDYLIHTNEGYEYVAYWSKIWGNRDHGHWVIRCECLHAEDCLLTQDMVTHWMTLPNPPQ